ncbi:ExbD/TolR family protein [Pontibacter rugosus]|uniref:ExbD/TolR family protein n=1 Tax=Pontibacter rugosus TaxID=1745966 RepID=A0ABW3SVF8_9BACT
MSAHLDMTPMVDLAFLLLTFFMLTTTFAKPQAMDISMPIDEGTSPVKAKNALTVILGEKDKIYYYFGFADDVPEVLETDFSSTGIRSVLLSEKLRANPESVVLIKATEASRYRNLVDILDEMKITDTRKYALVDLATADKLLLQEKGNL